LDCCRLATSKIERFGYDSWADQPEPTVQTVAMNDFLYFCPTCKAIYEIDRHHIRPPAEPICEGCQQQLPVADDGDWLTYRRTRPRLERVE
jgi:hypothetical protein